MTTKFKSLIWLRWQFLMSNKLFLLMVLSPLFYLYLFAALGDSKTNQFFVSTGINIVYSITAGSFVANMIAEEKEKRNLKTLFLTGVKQGDYILSAIFFPLVFSMISAVLVPLMMQIKEMNWLTYMVVVSLTILAFILINLLIAFLAKSQTQTTIFSMLIFMLATILPIFSLEMKGMDKVIECSFIGASNNYFTLLSDYQLSDSSLIALLIWIAVLAVALYFAYKRNGKLQ